MHITIDAQHAAPLRHALIQTCADQPWSIRLAMLPGGTRMRLSLTLPKAAINEAMLHVTDLAPGAEVGQLVEVPAEPTDAWRNVIRAGSIRGPAVAYPARPQAQAIGQLLCESNVVLGLDVPDQSGLFQALGALAARRYPLSAEAVTTALAVREASGSTGLGQGVAVPHGRIATVPQALGFYVRLLEPISFNAPDDQPVKDCVVLLFPEWDIYTHLHVLASVAQCFCDQHFRTSLQRCMDPKSVCTLFSGLGSSQAPVWR
ncbi:PTS sugar transporter subunit IIA [Cupriavidus sp. amp6]|uniref:PTS sugar transporter subunit IIA n=1 Tax=Cupriavidus sp. amp6 TaxID=388051 RepID=UPI000684A951|nr:PTS sugar transporter subunit IIA [Cupriavidus sp. amp6]